MRLNLSLLPHSTGSHRLYMEASAKSHPQAKSWTLGPLQSAQAPKACSARTGHQAGVGGEAVLPAHRKQIPQTFLAISTVLLLL